MDPEATQAGRHRPGELPPQLKFLEGGGRATDLILGRDWSGHVLGQPEAWPEALKVSLSLILNSPESMILSWGRDELSFFFNETYFPLLGPRLSWAMGAPFTEVWADGWAQAKPIIDEAFAGRSTRFKDLPWKLATDRGAAETWWSFSYSRILGSAGDIVGLFIFTNETTERVLADRRIARAEEQQRRAEEAGGIGLFAVDEAGIAYPTPSMCRLFGLTPAEVLPWSSFEAQVHEDDRDIAAIAIDQSESGSRDVEFRIRRADTGELRWISKKGELHGAGEDGVRRFVGVCGDVTERVTQRQALLDLNATLELQVAARTADRNRLWNLSSDVMVVAGFDGVIQAVNPAWSRILNWSEHELLDHSLLDFVHPDDQARTSLAVSDIGDGKRFSNFENRYRHKDGSYRYMTWSAGTGGDRIIGVGRDVTEQREAEAQLRQSQKMEAVGHLTGGIAHDFNNLLAGISGSLEFVNARLGRGSTEEAEKYLSAAQSSVRRAAALTHRLLAFSRQQALEPKPTKVNQLVGGMEDLVRRTVGPAIAVEVVGSPSAWTVLVDAPQLENALLNLCINARDAMPDGGRLTIETANRWVDHKAAQTREVPEGQYLALSVSDSGTGMSPEIIAKAFNPFFTTKPLGAGTGLGLSMVYGFAKQSGGEARIYSEVDQGTTVTLYLPRHHDSAETVEQPASSASKPSAPAGKTILLVDDEPTLRPLLAEVLRVEGYEVLEAADSLTGLKALQSPVHIDLLVSDVGLPGGMNGRQMADAGRVHRPNLKVLFITGYAENALISNKQLDPGMAVLTKPFGLETLTARVQEMMTKG